MSLRWTLFSLLQALCLSRLHRHLRQCLNHLKRSRHPLYHPSTLLYHRAPSPAAFRLSILRTWLQNTPLSVLMAHLKTRKILSTLILILDALTQIPATRILIPVLPSQRTRRRGRVFKVFSKTLNLKTCSPLSNSSRHFSRHLTTMSTVKWSRAPSNG